MAFATAEDVATYIKQDLSAEDTATVTFLLDQATAAIQKKTGQTIEEVTGDVVTLDAEPKCVLSLPQIPVTDVTEVLIDGVELSSSLYTWKSYGVLRRIGMWGLYPSVVAVTYDHGYAEIPYDLKMATCELVARAFQSGPGPSVVAITESLEGQFSYSERYAEAGAEGNLIDPAAIVKRYSGLIDP